MKIIIKTFAILVLFISSSCEAQQMAQTITDVYKLISNEQQFINKPLKYLLDEIKPEIKMVMATRDYPDYFIFKFIPIEELNLLPLGSNKTSFIVYLKEPIDWNFHNRTKGSEYSWTKEDINKYGNLTLIRIKVIGKD
jgi:hypothetical protein